MSIWAFIVGLFIFLYFEYAKDRMFRKTIQCFTSPPLQPDLKYNRREVSRLKMLATHYSGSLVPLLLLATVAPTVLADLLEDIKAQWESGGNGTQTWDDCDYSAPTTWRCGDVCLGLLDYCFCGNGSGDNTTQIQPLVFSAIPTKYCCASNKCARYDKALPDGNASTSFAFCRGQVLDISEPCAKTCYDDYWTSKHLSLTRSHYTCEHNQDCLKIQDMCSGASHCGDSRACNEKLRCDETSGVARKNLKPSKVIIEHSICHNNGTDNDRSFNNIDRSDEEITNEVNEKSNTPIDYRYLRPCIDNNSGLSGLTCHNTTSLSGPFQCAPVFGWCRSDTLGRGTCVTSDDGTLTSGSDERLCNNFTFWSTIEKNVCSINGVCVGKGFHCNGRSMQVVFPWYNFYSLSPKSLGLIESCQDKSDQFFEAETPCPDRRFFFSEHNKIFCSSNTGSFVPFCGFNYSSFANIESDLAKLDDPHNCRASCSQPGPNCTACSNQEYFRCTNSSKCLHPELRCDGHPQCPLGDDEDFELCKETYFQKGVVKKYATYKCRSKMYPGLFTIATACDNINECLEDKDEVNCVNSSFTTPILISSLVGVLLIFAALKIFENIRKITVEYKGIRNVDVVYKDLIKKLRENPRDEDNNKDLNRYFLYILSTKKTELARQSFIEFYDNLATLFNYQVAEVFCYMKQNLHQTVTKSIVEHKFRGLVTKISPLILFNDKVTATPGLRRSLSIVGALVSILGHFTDIVKDLTLCFSLLIISGGLSAIKDFPTNFSSAVVLTSMGTIIFPIILSSAHLALTSPFLVFNSTRLRARRWGRVVAGLGCLLLSPLNMVVLKTRLHIKKEEALHSAIGLGDDTLALYEECDIIEAYILKYLQHEIGIFLEITF